MLVLQPALGPVSPHVAATPRVLHSPPRFVRAFERAATALRQTVHRSPNRRVDPLCISGYRCKGSFMTVTADDKAPTHQRRADRPFSDDPSSVPDVSRAQRLDPDRSTARPIARRKESWPSAGASDETGSAEPEAGEITPIRYLRPGVPAARAGRCECCQLAYPAGTPVVWDSVGLVLLAHRSARSRR